MDKQKLETMATQAFENAKKNRAELWKVTEAHLTAIQDFENAKAQAYSSGKIDGKNAELREAQLRELLATEHATVDATQQAERLARYLYDVAALDVDTVKTLLRIAELPA